MLESRERVKIEIIKDNKKDFLDLLLLADEQENMMFDGDIQLIDMIYLKKDLRECNVAYKQKKIT
jgi:hypothetical protein